MIRFYSYRYNLIEPNTIQKSLFDEKIVKEELFVQLISELAQKKKISFIYRNLKYILFFTKKINQELYCIQLAKEEKFKKNVEGNETVVVVQDLRTPYVYILLDLKRQIVFIQDKTTVYNSVDIPKAKIESFFSDNLSIHNISFFLKPIIDKNEFWNEISTVDEIEKFDLRLNAPNLFNGRFKANDLVKEVYEETNITEFRIILINKLKQLKLYKANLEDYVALASAGAGKYTVTAYRNGKKFILSSIDKIIKKNYDIDKLEELDENVLGQDLDKLDKLNDDIL
jgi:hypothetical protein